MRHRKVINKLGRTTPHRKALVSNMATSLLEHKQIKTTLAKASAVRKTVDRLITHAKRGSLADRRRVLRVVQDKDVVKNLFEDIAPKFENRNGGYTRVIKLGRRRGDGADMALLELVGYEGALLEKHKAREEEKDKKDKAKTEKQKAEKQTTEE